MAVFMQMSRANTAPPVYLEGWIYRANTAAVAGRDP